MESSSLDYLRRQIGQRLKERGASQKALADAVGHTPQWLSMILRGERGIMFRDLDKIAAFLEVAPATLFPDPDRDSTPLREATGEVVHHEAATPSRDSVPDARRGQPPDILARQLECHAGTLKHVLGFLLEPGVQAVRGVLESMAAQRAEDRQDPLRPRATRSKGARLATRGRR